MFTTFDKAIVAALVPAVCLLLKEFADINVSTEAETAIITILTVVAVFFTRNKEDQP